MAVSQVRYNLDSGLVDQLTQLANKRGQTTESVITEAVLSYLQTQVPDENDVNNDPLIGLFSGSPDLATQSEDILQQSITPTSGWTWKPEQS
jgi:hypothetical protein